MVQHSQGSIWSGMVGRLTLVALFVAAPGPVAAQGKQADDKGLSVIPGAVRPQKTIVVRAGSDIPGLDKATVRLQNGKEVRYLKPDIEKKERRALRIVVPNGMALGSYQVDILSEDGSELATQMNAVTVLPAEAPAINPQQSIVSYPNEEGRYTFVISGDNFGGRAEDNVVFVNELPQKIPACAETKPQPCMVVGQGILTIQNFSLAEAGAERPLTVKVGVLELVSKPQPLLLSWVGRGVARGAAAAILLVVLGIVAGVGKLKAKGQGQGQGQEQRPWFLWFLPIDPTTNTYSLSGLQLLLWTGAAIFTYVYLGLCQTLVQLKAALPAIPDGLPLLLGLSGGTTALAMAATGTVGSKGAGPVDPTPKDLVATGDNVAIDRLQFLAWTLVGVLGFVGIILLQDPARVTELPKIPDGFLPLMGVSAAAYLAGKVARKPGPVIKKVTTSPTPVVAGAKVTLVIEGLSLSPRATCHLSPSAGGADTPINVATQSPQEFVEALQLDAPVAPMIGQEYLLRITNPDGQSADYRLKL